MTGIPELEVEWFGLVDRTFTDSLKFFDSCNVFCVVLIGGGTDSYSFSLSEVMAEEKESPRQSLIQTMEDRWQRTRDHFHSYPYVWASYIFVFGGLGLYTTHRWRALRKAEDELLRIQDRLKQTMSPKEIAEAMEDMKGRG